MEIKLIALDLDGTLLLPDKTLSKENKEILTRASQNGIYVTLATGRPYSAVKMVLEWLPCIRYVVLSNGSVIQDVQEEKIIKEHLIEKNDALALYDYVISSGLMADFFVRGERIVSPEWKQYVEQTKVSEETKQMLFANSHVVENQRSCMEYSSGIEKINIRFKNKTEKEKYYKMISSLFPQFDICSSLETNLEATSKGITKASGIQELILYLGIEMNAVMAFGDSENDYDMIKTAGIGVAMGNADENVKKIADRITKDNMQDGVAYMVKEVLGWQQELL